MSKRSEKMMNNDVILIVEDDRGLNSLIQKSLQRAGFKTEGVYNCAAAISRMSEANVKMMLLDYQLPDMNGSELVETLMGKGINVPFIIVTGHGDEKIAVEMMKLGARDYIIKDKGFMEMMPFSIERVVKDISKENKLAESEERIIMAAQEWRTTFDSIADFVSVHDKDFKITKANKAFAESLGMDVKNMIGRYCYDVIHHQSEPLADCPHMEMLVTKETVTRDIYNEAMGRHLMVSVSPIFDKDGELQGSVHYMKDITKIKESEEELKNRVDDLEKFYEMAINRELRMKELKRELKKLKGKSSGERAEVS